VDLVGTDFVAGGQWHTPGTGASGRGIRAVVTTYGLMCPLGSEWIIVGDPQIGSLR
jgi:hypothetical protein